jgi:hypothetical protein
MVYFKTKNLNLGKFWRAIEWQMLEYFTAIWYTCAMYGHLIYVHNVWPFGVVCGPLVYFSRFGMFGPRKIWQPSMNYETMLVATECRLNRRPSLILQNSIFSESNQTNKVFLSHQFCCRCWSNFLWSPLLLMITCTLRESLVSSLCWTLRKKNLVAVVEYKAVERTKSAQPSRTRCKIKSTM